MADEAQRRAEAHQQEVLQAVGALLSDGAGRAGYRRRQREDNRRRATEARAAPRPPEFDESGFPIPQRRDGFARRVARLLNV